MRVISAKTLVLVQQMDYIYVFSVGYYCDCVVVHFYANDQLAMAEKKLQNKRERHTEEHRWTDLHVDTI